MNELFTINQIAQIANITVRTLHYYDEINLLKPSTIAENGYRLYSNKDIARLQEVMTLKELGFSLKDIKILMESDTITKVDAFKMQKTILTKQLKRLEKIINSLDKLLEENKMDFEQFDTTEIEKARDKYKNEAKKRWGHSDAYKESEKKTNSYGKSDWKRIESEAETIYSKFVERLQNNISASDNADIVKAWQNHITKNYYKCTDEILSGLGQMYVADERFTKNIDKRCDGLAEYMADSIAKYCE